MPEKSSDSPGPKSPFCFLSYARASGPAYAKRFAQDLTEELTELRKFGAEEDPLFFDQTEIDPGSKWTERLETGLKKSKVMVSLLSEHYFQSDYCGKEFQVFLHRRAELQREKNLGETPGLIVPILWVPERFLGSEVPDSVKEIQYATENWNKDYWKEGLLQLIKNEKYSTQYKDFLRKLAVCLLEVSQRHPLQDLAQLESLKAIQSAFTAKTANVAAPPWDGGSIQFVYVAATSAEAQKFTKDVCGYDPKGGRFWKPYLPPIDSPIGVITQFVASKEGFASDALPLDAPLQAYIARAKQGDNLLIILLDCCSLELDRYRSWISSYDEVFSANCEVLIPLNEADPQVVTRRARIEELLTRTFPQRSARLGVEAFAVRANSEADFRKKLARKIQEVRALITRVKAQSTANTSAPGVFPLVAGPGVNSR